MNGIDNGPLELPEHIQSFIATYSPAERSNVCEFLYLFVAQLRDGDSSTLHETALANFKRAFRTEEEFRQTIEWIGLGIDEGGEEITRNASFTAVSAKTAALINFAKKLSGVQAQPDFSDGPTNPDISDVELRADLVGQSVEEVMLDDLNMPEALRETYKSLENGELLTEGRIRFQNEHYALFTLKDGVWPNDTLFTGFRYEQYVHVIKKFPGVLVKARYN